MAAFRSSYAHVWVASTLGTQSQIFAANLYKLQIHLRTSISSSQVGLVVVGCGSSWRRAPHLHPQPENTFPWLVTGQSSIWNGFLIQPRGCSAVELAIATVVVRLSVTYLKVGQEWTAVPCLFLKESIPALHPVYLCASVLPALAFRLMPCPVPGSLWASGWLCGRCGSREHRLGGEVGTCCQHGSPLFSGGNSLLKALCP